MIYYFTKHVQESNPFKFQEIPWKDVLRTLGNDNADPIKGAPGYFKVRVDERYLTGQDEVVVPPTVGDVVIFPEMKYGIGSILKTTQEKETKVYDLLLHQLHEVPFGESRTMRRPSA